MPDPTINRTVSAQLQHDFNATYRIIYLQDAIDALSPSLIHSKALAIADLSGDEETPITLQISCYGGDVYAMLGIVDMFELLPMKVNTQGWGPVMSAATTVLVGGTGERTITKNTVVMNHEMNTWFQGRSSDIEKEAEHNKQLQEKLYTLLESRTKKNADFWRQNSKTNLYLPAETCLEYGMIDKII